MVFYSLFLLQFIGEGQYFKFKLQSKLAQERPTPNPDNTDLKTGMENLFNGMSTDISNFWSFQIETDAIESNRLKIIDENQT